MWPSPIFWWRSLNAPRTSIESFACTSRSRSGPPISTIRSTVAAAPPGSSSGAPAANTWQVSRQTPALGWKSRAARYGSRSSTPAHSERPWPAVGSSSSHGASSPATASSSGSRPSRTWRIAAAYRSAELARIDVRAGVHDHALDAGLRRPAQVVGDRRDRLLVRRRGRGAEVHEVRRVHEHPHAALGDRGPEPLVLRGLAGRSAPSRAGCRRRSAWSRSRARRRSPAPRPPAPCRPGRGCRPGCAGRGRRSRGDPRTLTRQNFWRVSGLFRELRAGQR